MEAALQLHQHALDALVAFDTGAMTPIQIGQGLLRLQKHVELPLRNVYPVTDAESARVAEVGRTRTTRGRSSGSPP
ncbi:MAG: hypothetical protein ABIR32_13875 [Ilumatobacteraceae bacterium]